MREWESPVTEKLDREKCIYRLAHLAVILVQWIRQIFWFKSFPLPVNTAEKSSFVQLFILWEDGSWQIYKLSNSRQSTSRTWSWEWQSCLFIHWQKSFDISKYWKTILKVTLAPMTLTLKYGFILFSCWNRQDQWCSTCQRWPYWLEEMMWLEFLQRVLENALFLHTVLSLTGKENNGYSNFD